MMIDDVQAWVLCIPLKKTLVTSYGTRNVAEFVIVEIKTSDGLVGVGEASPIPSYNEGDPVGSLFVLQTYIRPLLLGKDPTQIFLLHRLMDEAVRGYYYLKSAIDMALFDLLGKVAELPLYRLLGGRPSPIPVVWLVSPSEGRQGIEEAVRKAEEGFRAVKVKVGLCWQDELRFLKDLRYALGPDIQICVDANGAWDWKTALHCIRELEAIGVARVEQPVPSWDLEGLRRVTKSSSIPIVADESARTLREAFVIAKLRAADFLNIKISGCGGIKKALEIAAIAEAGGMSVVVGSMLEYGVGTAAGAHFASLFNCETAPAEIVGPLLAQDDIVTPPIKYSGGCIYLDDRPGLGVELDRQKLKMYMQKGGKL